MEEFYSDSEMGSIFFDDISRSRITANCLADLDMEKIIQ